MKTMVFFPKGHYEERSFESFQATLLWLNNDKDHMMLCIDPQSQLYAIYDQKPAEDGWNVYGYELPGTFIVMHRNPDTKTWQSLSTDHFVSLPQMVAKGRIQKREAVG